MSKTYPLSKRLTNHFRFAALFVITLFFTACSAIGSSPGVSKVDNNFIVNINARTSTKKNPVSIKLDAGTYNISVIGTSGGGAFNAWKPWFYKEKQNDKGEWIRGWINNYSFSSEEFGEVTCR